MAPTVFLGSPRNCRQPWGAPSCHLQRPALLDTRLSSNHLSRWKETGLGGRQKTRAPSPPCASQTPHLVHGFQIDKHGNKDRQDH